MVLLTIIIVGKAFYIQRTEGAYWRGVSDSLQQRVVELDADRGTIYSEDGQMLTVGELTLGQCTGYRFTRMYSQACQLIFRHPFSFRPPVNGRFEIGDLFSFLPRWLQ